MEAVVLSAFGPPENLLLQELPDLEPGAEECRIAVRASGVHLVDTTMRRGESGPMPLPSLPTIPGREVVGVIDRVGSSINPAVLGTRVVAHLGQVPGGYASQAVTAFDNVVALPDHVGDEDALAMIGTGRTTLGVLEQVPIRADDVVLVLAAAGGIGWLLVQAAREAGATVVAAARGAAKLGLLRRLEPDLVVDYATDAWTADVVERVDPPTLLFDGVGGHLAREAASILRTGSRIAIYGYSSGEPTNAGSPELASRRVDARFVLGPPMLALPGGIAGLAQRALERLAEHRWSPLVSAYPLADAAIAHRDLEERRTAGKVVLRVG